MLVLGICAELNGRPTAVPNEDRHDIDNGGANTPQ